MGKLDYFPAQMAVIQAVSSTLDNQKSAFICGEMGCGKTALSIASVLTHNNDSKRLTNIVLCPGHLVEKWKCEIERLAPISDVVIIDNLKTVMSLENRIR